MRLLRTSLAIFAAAVLTGCQRDEMTIRVTAPPETAVVVGIHDAGGAVVRQYVRKGGGVIQWDGMNGNGQPVPAGGYRWTAATHLGFGARLSGSACFNQASESLPAPAELPRWGGNGGTPSAVAADDARVYLGWSGGQVAACDLDGRLEWSIALPEGAGCRALAVDGETIVVHTRRGPPSATGDHLVKLSARDGALVEWTTGPALPITALWAADAETKPAQADAMSARSGRIYLTFSDLQFFAVLRTDTGEYLQTVVGPPASGIDVTPTKTESPDEPGKIVDADFAIVALRGGALGKVLFAHEPFWVMTSDFQSLDRDERITALTLLGDGAKHHPHSVFVALDAPFHQVQRRSVLASEGFLWIAGRVGGRAPAGPWAADALGRVNAIALDARGRLWVAEGDAVPPRFSVWSTEGNQGRLEREFFGPVSAGDRGAAVLPGDPEVLVGVGCEWRIDPGGGPAKCLGVITRDGMVAAGFHRSESGTLMLSVRHPDNTVSIFERRGEGDYAPRQEHSAGSERGFAPGSQITLRPTGIAVNLQESGSGTWIVGTPDGLRLGIAMQSLGLILADESASNTRGISSPAQSPDGKVYAAVAARGLFRMEITGLDSIRRLPGGKLTVRPKK